MPCSPCNVKHVCNQNRNFGFPQFVNMQKQSSSLCCDIRSNQGGLIRGVSLLLMSSSIQRGDGACCDAGSIHNKEPQGSEGFLPMCRYLHSVTGDTGLYFELTIHIIMWTSLRTNILGICAYKCPL